MYAYTLQDAIRAKRNPTVAGLDPRPDHIPPDILAAHTAERGETLEALAAAYEEFILGLIDALADVVPAVKPQWACYEELGLAGMAALTRIVAAAKERGLYVIADAKRGDIGSTAEAYSAGFLGRVKVGGTEHPVWDTNAMTVNPYLGSDCIKAFLTDCERFGKMIFMLCRTSNPSSFEVQELPAGDRALYKVVAEYAEVWGSRLIDKSGFSALGIVAGATHPAQIRALREQLPKTFFLVPGYGSQGGAASDAAAAFDKRGWGAIVNSSRAISCAWKKSGGDYKDAARAEAIRMRDELKRCITIV